MLNVTRERQGQIQRIAQECQSDDESALSLSPSSAQSRRQIAQMLGGYILSNSVATMILPDTGSKGAEANVRPHVQLLDWRLGWPIPGEQANFIVKSNVVDASGDDTRQRLLLKSVRFHSLIQTVLVTIYKDNITSISIRCKQVQEHIFRAYISLLGFRSRMPYDTFCARSDDELKWASLCLQKYSILPSYVYVCQLFERVAFLNAPSKAPHTDLKYAQCSELALPGEVVRFLRISKMMR